jgi:hypothetical protein
MLAPSMATTTRPRGRGVFLLTKGSPALVERLTDANIVAIAAMPLRFNCRGQCDQETEV